MIASKRKVSPAKKATENWGVIGARLRNQKMSRKERTASASHAAKARWQRYREDQKKRKK